MQSEKILNLLIIEDNALYATALKQFLETNLENFSYSVSITTFKTSEGCIEALNRSKLKPDIIILDYFLNSQVVDAMNGLNAMFYLKTFNADSAIIFLSAQDKINITVQSLHTGAFDYIAKDDFAFQNVLYAIEEYTLSIETNGSMSVGRKKRNSF